MKAFDLFEGDTKSGIRSKLLLRGMAVYKVQCMLNGLHTMTDYILLPQASASLEGLHAKLVSECEELLSSHPQHALLSLVQLTLWEQGSHFVTYCTCSKSVPHSSSNASTIPV